jgi:hypothetical protein
MLSHLKERKQRNGKLKNIVKNPLVCPIEITFSDGWRRKEGVYTAEMKEQSILSFFVQRAAKRDSLQTYSPKTTPLFKELH